MTTLRIGVIGAGGKGAASTSPLPFPHCSRVHHFVNALLGKETPIIAVAEALAVQKILDAIYNSAETHREVLL